VSLSEEYMAVERRGSDAVAVNHGEPHFR
jgi:hypothetical protein